MSMEALGRRFVLTTHSVYTAEMALADAQRFWFRDPATYVEPKEWVTLSADPELDGPTVRLALAVYRRIETAARKGLTFIEFQTFGPHSIFADLGLPHDYVHVDVLFKEIRYSGLYTVLIETKTGFGEKCPTVTALRVKWN
jgi:hypothetical protein